MRSPPNAIESFFVAEVMDKGIAENNMIDQNGHTVMSGELYLEVCYLQKAAQKKKMWHQLPKKLHCILTHVAEVFIANTALDADLCMVINEYQSILSASTWFFFYCTLCYYENLSNKLPSLWRFTSMILVRLS